MTSDTSPAGRLFEEGKRLRAGVLKHDGTQGYLAHKKQPPPLGPTQGPRHSPAVGWVELLLLLYYARA